MSDVRYCSFCGGSEEEVEVIVACDDASICCGCIEICRDILGAYRFGKKEEEKQEAE